ncbi:MAG: hypothetical protein H6807_16325 [Planctomycetes bacterium]|nr:hypothetical protein [Planctomycetota bacterium]
MRVPEDDRKGLERLSRKAAAWLLTLVVLTAAATELPAQLFRWRDDEGLARAGKNPDEAPLGARETMTGSVRVVEVLDGERFRVEGDLVVRLIGLDAPDGALSHDEAATVASRRALAALIEGKDLELRFESRLRDPRGVLRAWAIMPEGELLNELSIAGGHARLIHQAGGLRFRDRLEAAEQKARTAKRGLFAGDDASPPPRSLVHPFTGFALGLYAQDPEHDYTPLLREQKEIGARDLLLVTPWFMDDHKATTIEPMPGRSCTLATVARTARQARALGLEVGLMPIVLLRNPDRDHWRGNIAPADRDDWFDSYGEFIAAFADIARDTGARMLMVGSEYSSLEGETERWQEILRDLRRRFPGLLSYSANWDHVQALGFRDDLDAIGMTGYHSLTGRDDPSVAELTEAWRRLRAKLEAELDGHGIPYFFSELGYASLDGINRNPWDYVSPTRTDPQEQADCFEAYLRAWAEPGPLFRGAYYYTWWRNDDASDERGYTVRGKPAEKLLRAAFRGEFPSREH